MPNPLLAPVLAWARKLRHPTLFKLIAVLFVVDVLVPDVIPFADELLLGLATLLLGRWTKKDAPHERPLRKP